MKKEFKIRKFVRNPKKEDLKNQLIKAPTTTQLSKSDKKKVGKEIVRIDNLLFTSKNRFQISKKFSTFLNNEVLMSAVSPDDTKLITTLMDGSFYLYDSVTEKNSFYESVNYQFPLTAVMWKDNKNILLGDTGGSLYEYQYNSEKNTFHKTFNVQEDDEQIFTIDYNQTV